MTSYRKNERDYQILEFTNTTSCVGETSHHPSHANRSNDGIPVSRTPPLPPALKTITTHKPYPATAPPARHSSTASITSTNQSCQSKLKKDPPKISLTKFETPYIFRYTTCHWRSARKAKDSNDNAMNSLPAPCQTCVVTARNAHQRSRNLIADTIATTQAQPC